MLWDEELLSSPQAALNAVCDFAGLQRINVTAFPQGSEAAVAALLDAAYPGFERTGWRLNAQYEPLGQELKQQLSDFFAPFNRALFEYLGRVPPVPWT